MVSRPWKQSFRQVPPTVRSALATIRGELVIVAATKKIPVADIASGAYGHLGMRLDGSTVMAKSPVVPDSGNGTYAERNRNGWEIVLKDEPKVTKAYSWETPNFGDASTYGTHTHYQSREVYQRKLFQPRHLPITVEVLKHPESGAGTAVVKFAVDCVLDRTRDDFTDDLLFCVNLLQENAGIVGVYPSSATREAFIGTIALDWEVFPPGTADEVVAAFLGSRRGKGTRKPSGELADRIELFRTLKPACYLRGTGSFGSYVGAQFADDLIVFENLTYGNALYVLYDSWADISKRSRLDLLKGTTKNFDRFPHTADWKDRFTEHMKIELRKRKRSTTAIARAVALAK